jgi:hypothetical protein
MRLDEVNTIITYLAGSSVVWLAFHAFSVAS